MTTRWPSVKYAADRHVESSGPDHDSTALSVGAYALSSDAVTSKQPKQTQT